ncbi:MAG TPA: hypothetical protein VNT28_04135 [Candidatus Limnocylindrales bacterium]|jgi:hypothetical protein|nr:hypothetical protein [Candidatus Limnocylindrales bacterium]
MRRPVVLAVGVMLALAAAFAQALAGPLPARACSCIDPLPSLARVASEPNVTVIVGTIGQQQPERTPVGVEGWFTGPGVTDVVWLNFGSQAMTSCDPFVTAGEKRLMVLHPNGDGTYSVNPCVASGVIGTEAGDAALAEAQALFVAQPTPGPSPSDPPAAPQPLPDGADGGWLMVLGVLGVATLAFAAVVLIATRRRGAD